MRPYPKCIQNYWEELEEEGITVIRRAIDLEIVSDLKKRVLELHEGSTTLISENVPMLNRTSDIVYNLQNKYLPFLTLLLRHEILAPLLRKALNDRWYKKIPEDKANFVLRAVLARNGGTAALPPHIDSFVPSSGKLPWICQASLMLDPHTPERGATLVVPKSHRSDRYAPQDALDNATSITGEPGDLVLWDGRLWHGTNSNTSSNSRWSVIASFCRWWIKPNFDYTATLPNEFYQQLTDEERGIIGFCSNIPKDETEWIDLKRGHADLPSSI